MTDFPHMLEWAAIDAQQKSLDVDLKEAVEAIGEDKMATLRKINDYEGGCWAMRTDMLAFVLLAASCITGSWRSFAALASRLAPRKPHRSRLRRYSAISLRLSAAATNT